MNLYFAPLEGIGTYTYRNTHFECFGNCDYYFSPFITPTGNEKLSIKTMRDILPINNTTPLKVQCLTNSVKGFLEFCDKISSYGYNEVNLNLGCPSSTVVKKGRGAGALKDLETLKDFLDEIFKYVNIKVSVKSRVGFSSYDEFSEILNLFKNYPFSEIIIHPRVREDYYKGSVNLDTYHLIYRDIKTTLCYNGDITSKENYENIINKFPKTDNIMIGRGAIKNPAIFREIKGGEKLKTKEIIDFSKKLEEKYMVLLESDAYTLHKLKEIWLYMIQNYPDETKILKAIKKSTKLAQLNGAIEYLGEIKEI